MKLAMVLGPCTSTVKHPVFSGQKLLAIQPLGVNLKPRGRPLLAIDSVDAGKGDVVLVLQEGRSTRDFVKDPKAAARTLIAGVVDRVELGAPPSEGANPRSDPAPDPRKTAKGLQSGPERGN